MNTPTTGRTAPPAGSALREAGLAVRPLPVLDGLPSLREAISARSGPALVRGLLEDWPARRQWTPEQLTRTRGDARVTALVDLPSDGVLLPADQAAYERESSFGEFLTRIRETPLDRPCYMAYARAGEVLPDSDHDFPGLLGHDGTDTDTRAWVGSAGTRSMLHSDLMDNVFCQIWGQKDVVLAPWESSSSVYPFRDNLVNSRIDVADPRPDQFPLLRRATFLAGSLGPGDLLYIPRGCWHDFRARTPSISLNHWFGQSLTAADYLRLLGRLGPGYWGPTARDFLRYGLFARRESTRFLFSPPSTGRRLWDLVVAGDFSRSNDPTTAVPDPPAPAREER